ncbi:MAG: ABC transporter ATP-binding protein [Pyrinomonadaceae bacterium]|nr:ABC transporter ATP-binding protein [Pyrinomonadaceae bacterium]
MKEKLVEVREVKKSYSTTVAVDGVSLCVNAGEIYALVGANGAGKSTLIRMITGITYPDEGSVQVCGEDTRKGARAKRYLGYLPEELTFYERLSGREYLQLVAGLKEADAAQVDEALAFFELKAVAEKWVGGYSLGMRKKLGLAAAMINNPQVLVLDEPLNGLDVEMMRKLRARLESQKQMSRSVIVSSHYMDFVERIADRIGIMSRGLLVAEGTAKALREKAELPSAPFEDVFFKLAG